MSLKHESHPGRTCESSCLAVVDEEPSAVRSYLPSPDGSNRHSLSNPTPSAMAKIASNPRPNPNTDMACSNAANRIHRYQQQREPLSQLDLTAPHPPVATDHPGRLIRNDAHPAYPTLLWIAI